MKPITLAALFFAAFTSLPAQTPAQSPATPNPHPYTALYVFGDSYSDTGAGFLYADGPTAVAYLAQRLNIPFTYYGAPDAKGKSLNFAVSGAKTGSDPGERTPTGLFHLGMQNQIEQFAALLKSKNITFDPAQTMFFLAGGLNDRGTSTHYTKNNLESEIDTLYALGARRFMVALLPTKIPLFATAGTTFNPDLFAIPADELAKHPDIRIANSDWGPYFDEVITHLDKYGLADTKLTCGDRQVKLTNPVPCATANHFYYYAAHPSTAAHKPVGDMLYTEAITKAP